jgi:hypothetical protein
MDEKEMKPGEDFKAPKRKKPRSPVANAAIKEGATLGAVLSAILSWDHNHSILWMVVHSFCGWFYVFYYWWRH